MKSYEATIEEFAILIGTAQFHSYMSGCNNVSHNVEDTADVITRVFEKNYTEVCSDLRNASDVVRNDMFEESKKTWK